MLSPLSLILIVHFVDMFLLLCLLVDDMVDTAGTLCKAADLIKEFVSFFYCSAFMFMTSNDAFVPLEIDLRQCELYTAFLLIPLYIICTCVYLCLSVFMSVSISVFICVCLPGCSPGLRLRLAWRVLRPSLQQDR